MKTKTAYKYMGTLGALCFLFIFNNLLFAQGGNNCADASLSPISIPFSAVGQTVTGKVNDYNSSNTIRCSNIPAAYMNGEDYLYYFFASTTGTIIINISNISVGNRASLHVYKGCPNTGSCVAASYDNNFASAIVLTANIKQGNPYYIMLDGTNGYNYNITVNYIPVQPACTNMDFEAGNFSGWTGTNGRMGDGQTVDDYPNYIGISINTSPPQINLINSGTDACGGFPRVCPGGTYSAMLGDGQVPNYHGAQLIQSFQVTPSNSAFFYKYAMVVQDAGHADHAQPYIRINMYDENGDTIPCGQYLVVGGPDIPNFFPASCGANVYYRPWTSVTTDLSAYIGQNVTIIFTQADCGYGAHWSYAYIDCSCNVFGLTETRPDSCSPVTLSAPSGFASYYWSPGGQTTQSITVTSSGNYCCDLISVTGCPIHLCKNIVIRTKPLVTVNSPIICNGITTTLTASGTNNYIWNNSSTQSFIIVTPSITTTYSVTGTASTGCKATATAIVTVNPKPILTTNSPVICAGNSTTLTVNGGINYTWSNGQTSQSIIINPVITTTYFVTGININGCTNSAQAVVTVNSNPLISATGATICNGNSATISANGGANYLWSNGQTAQSIIVNPIITTNYFVTGTNLNGCSNSAQAVVTVNPNPVISATGATICNGN
ncbi:MAG: hypothetical protein PHD97_01935, partial [Bacteroidales bacterium]|nr:hypothetical protein [Bacteroidales bacterium]